MRTNRQVRRQPPRKRRHAKARVVAGNKELVPARPSVNRIQDLLVVVMMMMMVMVMVMANERHDHHHCDRDKDQDHDQDHEHGTTASKKEMTPAVMVCSQSWGAVCEG